MPTTADSMAAKTKISTDDITGLVCISVFFFLGVLFGVGLLFFSKGWAKFSS